MSQNFIAGEDIYFEYDKKGGNLKNANIDKAYVANRDMTVEVELSNSHDDYPVSRVIKQEANGNVVVQEVSDNHRYKMVYGSGRNNHEDEYSDGEEEEDYIDDDDDEDNDDCRRSYCAYCQNNHRCDNELQMSEYYEDEDEEEYEDDIEEDEYENGYEDDDEDYNDHDCQCPDHHLHYSDHNHHHHSQHFTSNNDTSDNDLCDHHHDAHDEHQRPGNSIAHNHNRRPTNAQRTTLLEKQKKIIKEQIQKPVIGNFLWDFEYPEDIPDMIQFWISLSYANKRELASLDFSEILNLIHENQKSQQCSCRLCGNRKSLIEKELEQLYNGYYNVKKLASESLDELDLNINSINAIFGVEEERTIETETDNDENPETLRKELLSMADDLVKNNGEHFINLIEKLDDKKREERIATENQSDIIDKDDEDDEEAQSDSYASDNESCSSNNSDNDFTSRKRLEETYKMLQILSSKILRKKVHDAFQAKRAEDISKSLLAEEEREAKLKKEKEEKEKKKREKAKEKKRLQKIAKEEERKKIEREKEEAQRLQREEQLRKTEEGRKRKEAERKKREEELKIKQEEKRRRKEAEMERLAKEKEEKERRKQEAKKQRDEEMKKRREEKERKEKEKQLNRQKNVSLGLAKSKQGKEKGIEEKAKVKLADKTTFANKQTIVSPPLLETQPANDSVELALEKNSDLRLPATFTESSDGLIDPNANSINNTNILSNFLTQNTLPEISNNQFSNLNSSSLLNLDVNKPLYGDGLFDSSFNQGNNQFTNGTGVSNLSNNFLGTDFNNTPSLPTGLFGSTLFDSGTLNTNEHKNIKDNSIWGTTPSTTVATNALDNGDIKESAIGRHNSIWLSTESSEKTTPTLSWNTSNAINNSNDNDRTSVSTLVQNNLNLNEVESVQFEVFKLLNAIPNLTANTFTISTLYQYIKPLLVGTLPSLTEEQLKSALLVNLSSKLQISFQIFKDEKNMDNVKIINHKFDGLNNNLMNINFNSPGMHLNNLDLNMNYMNNSNGFNGFNGFNGLNDVSNMGGMNGVSAMNNFNSIGHMNSNISLNDSISSNRNMNSLNMTNNFGVNNMNNMNMNGLPGINDLSLFTGLNGLGPNHRNNSNEISGDNSLKTLNGLNGFNGMNVNMNMNLQGLNMDMNNLNLNVPPNTTTSNNYFNTPTSKEKAGNVSIQEDFSSTSQLCDSSAPEDTSISQTGSKLGFINQQAPWNAFQT